MTRLLLHIGTTKTGTSSIQANFNAGAARLAARGCIYPQSGVRRTRTHHNLAYEIGADFHATGRFRPDAGTWDETLAEIDAAQPDVAVISTEAFSFLTAEEVMGLADRLSGRAVEIVLYLRRQDGWMHSLFKQRAKFGRVPFDIRAYLEEDRRTRPWSVDVRSQLRMWRDWSAAFGAERMRVFRYDRSVIGADVVTHFLGLCGLTPAALGPAARRVNESPKLKTMVAARLLQERCAAELGPDFELSANTAARLGAFFRERPDFLSRYSLFSVDHARLAIAQYAEETAELGRLMNDPEFRFPEPVPAEYADYVPDPMALAAKLDAEERDFLEAAAANTIRYLRNTAG